MLESHICVILYVIFFFTDHELIDKLRYISDLIILKDHLFSVMKTTPSAKSQCF